MTVVFSRKFEDIARITAGLCGLPLDGRKLTLSTVDKKIGKALSYYKDFGYISLFSAVINQKIETIFTWGDDLFETHTLFDENRIPFLKKVLKESEQAENLKGIFTGKIDDLIFAGKSEDNAYFKDVLTLYNIERPLIRLCKITEFSEEALKTAFSSGLTSVTSSEIALDKAGCYRSAIDKIDIRLKGTVSSVLPTAEYPGIETLSALSYIYQQNKKTISKASNDSTYKIAVTGNFAGRNFVLSSKLSFSSKDLAERALKDLPAAAEVISKGGNTIEKEFPKGAFTNSRLLVAAKKGLGFSSEQTLAALSYLYSGGFITDPQTESSLLPKNSRNVLFDRLSAFKESSVGDLLAAMKLPNARDEYFSENDTHGIIITEKKPVIKNKDAKSIYRLIVTELIKVYYPPREEKTFKITAKGGGYTFSGRGKKLVRAGFSELENRKPINENVPFEIEKGSMIALSYRISAPGTSSTLPGLSTMSKYDFGPLPLSEQIRILSSLGLITVTNDKYSIEKKAYPILRILRPCSGLLDGKFIRILCSNLETISNDDKQRRKEAEDIVLSDLDALIDYWQKSILEGRAVEVPVHCPVCLSTLKESSGRLLCDDCGFETDLIISGRTMNMQEMEHLFQEGSTPLIDGFNGDYLARLYLSSAKEVFITRDSQYSCPVCGEKMRVRKSDRAYVCSCGYELRRIYKGHEFTKKELSTLFTTLQLPKVKINEGGAARTVTLILDKGKQGRITEL